MHNACRLFVGYLLIQGKNSMIRENYSRIRRRGTSVQCLPVVWLRTIAQQLWNYMIDIREGYAE